MLSTTKSYKNSLRIENEAERRIQLPHLYCFSIAYTYHLPPSYWENEHELNENQRGTYWILEEAKLTGASEWWYEESVIIDNNNNTIQA